VVVVLGCFLLFFFFFFFILFGNVGLHPIHHYKIGERFSPGWTSTDLDTMQDGMVHTWLHPFCKNLLQSLNNDKKYF
jgi:hypothetical protein